MFRFYFVLTFFFVAQMLPAQTTEQKATNFPPEFRLMEDSLVALGKTFLNNRDLEQRQAAVDSFDVILKNLLQKEGSFDYPFDSLRQVSIQYPEDQRFRIFTWQHFIDMDTYQYFGIIQLKDKPDALIELTDKSGEVEEVDYDILTTDNWYGALYYNIEQFKTKEGRKYLLFGFDAHTLYHNRKLVDVLSFNGDELTFGAPVFAKESTGGRPPVTKNRLMLEYSAEISIRLNYDPHLKHIIHDHLKFKTGNYGQGDVMVTDGSYEGFYLKKGLWYHVDKMFNYVSDEPPRPQPILDIQKKKDIFGRND